MTLDDTEAVARNFGRVTPVDPQFLQTAINGHDRLKAEFQDGDTLFHYNTVTFLAGSFGYLRVRNGEIVGRYVVGMS